MAQARIGGYNAGQALAINQSGETQLVRRFGNAVRVNAQATGIESRTHVFDFPDAADIASVEILSQPSTGRVGARADHSIHYTTSLLDTGVQTFTARVTYTDGQVGDDRFSINLEETEQIGGWDLGLGYYYLPKDADARFIAEPGLVHRKLYIDTGGMDAAAIAAHASANGEAGTDAGDITTSWLRARPVYGGSESMAIRETFAPSLWSNLTAYQVTSHHLYLKRGQTIPQALNLGMLYGGATGESARHPVFVGAWGPGTERPIVLTDFGYESGGDAKFCVIQDVSLKKVRIVNPSTYIALDHLELWGGGMGVQKNKGITAHHVRVQDVWPTQPNGGRDFWDQDPDRSAGFYSASVESYLVEGCFADLCGWNPAYDPNTVAYPATVGMGPGVYSHCAYMQYGSKEVTVKRSIFARGAFGGLKMRSGGFVEDCMMIENPSHLDVLGGDFAGRGSLDQYGVVSGLVITGSPTYEIQPWTNSNSLGFSFGGGVSMTNPARGDALVGTIVCHLANPNDQSEITDRAASLNAGIIDAVAGEAEPFDNRNYHYANNRLFNWGSQTQMGTAGISVGAMNATTIHNWFDAEFGLSGASIASGMAEWRGVYAPETRIDSALAYFRDGFNVHYSTRTGATTCDFAAHDATEGRRWDNRMNWATQDLPGRNIADAVDTRGFDINFGTINAVIGSADLRDGHLRVDSGSLIITGAITGDGATVTAQNCGWISAGGYGGDGLTVNVVESGRFQNTGTWSGAADLTLTGGQAILAGSGNSYTVPNGSTLEIQGGTAGFDGTGGGAAVLVVAGTLRFTATGGAFGSLQEFRSGMNGLTEPDVVSNVALNGALEIDVTGAPAGSYDLIVADIVTGTPAPLITGGVASISYASVGRVILTVM